MDRQVQWLWAACCLNSAFVFSEIENLFAKQYLKNKSMDVCFLYIFLFTRKFEGDGSIHELYKTSNRSWWNLYQYHLNHYRKKYYKIKNWKMREKKCYRNVLKNNNNNNKTNKQQQKFWYQSAVRWKQFDSRAHAINS